MTREYLLPTTATLLLALGACDHPTISCSNADPLWTTSTRTPEPVIDVVSVKKAGVTLLNGEATTRDALVERFRQYTRMGVSPDVLLRNENGADCRDVSALREMMRHTLNCSSGKCGEGPEWDWVPANGINGFDGGG